MPLSRCIGANFHLGEGMRCASPSVISVPMFGFHLRSSSLFKPTAKENIILVDNDSGIDAVKLEDDLKSLGISDARVFVHIARRLKNG